MVIKLYSYRKKYITYIIAHSDVGCDFIRNDDGTMDMNPSSIFKTAGNLQANCW